MTALTKTQNKLDDFRSSLPEKVSEKLQAGIQALTELIDLFAYRKRKTGKDDMKSLYDWFDDEFNVRFEAVAVMIRK